jgi:N-carbamoylputrescine amidase
VINSKGEIIDIYRKMHIPDDPAYYEKFYFTPGDLGYKTFDTEFGKIGTLICWDQWYPEAARLTALKGASVIFYPTAIGWHPHEKEQHGRAQFESWQTIQRAHSIANGIYVASVNRIGIEKQNPESLV